MAVTQRTKDGIRDDILSIVKDRRVNVDISPNTIVYDIIAAITEGALFPIANDLFLAYANLFLDNVSDRVAEGTIDSLQLDLIGSTYGLPRKGSTVATGHVYFVVGTIPTQDITIPFGSVVGTNGPLQNSPVLRYSTLETKTLSVANIQDFYVPELTAYAISVLVQAEQPGTSYNLPIGAITRIFTQVSGITDVINLEDITTGTDTELDLVYAQRIQQIANNSLGITQDGGITRFLMQQPGITNVAVLRNGDPNVLRLQGFGVMDVYIRDKQLVSTQDINNFDGNSIVFLTKTPVENVTSIKTSSGIVLQKNTDFIFNPDITGVYKSSSRASDSITLLTFPVLGESYTINYTYNSNPSIYTNLFNQEPNRVQGRDLLCYEGIEVPAFIAVTVTKFLNLSNSFVIGDIQVALINFINSRNLLGATIFQGDIISVLTKTQSIQNILVDSIEIRKLNDTPGVSEDLIPQKLEYITLTEANIHVTITNG